MRFVPLKAEHLLALQGVSNLKVSVDAALDVEEIGGWSAVENGKLLASGGIVEHPAWPGTGLAWTALTREWRRHARVITDWVELALIESEYDRIEAHVRRDLKGAHRWIKRLGFRQEGCLKSVHDGYDFAIYARLRNG